MCETPPNPLLDQKVDMWSAILKVCFGPIADTPHSLDNSSGLSAPLDQGPSRLMASSNLVVEQNATRLNISAAQLSPPFRQSSDRSSSQVTRHPENHSNLFRGPARTRLGPPIGRTFLFPLRLLKKRVRRKKIAPIFRHRRY